MSSPDWSSREPEPERGRRVSAWRFLLLIPFIGTLWVPFYNHALPAVFGFPFFYWYQLVAVPLSAVIIFIVYKAES
ncbi:MULTISPECIES: DUF3311 domain-containing protein [Acidiphilium]|jgi:uncharacterized membrane protein|uniref:Uncharacterized protein n=1 Tax=Acidiphilium rubrum TaxID=526 RepID=A0A8G2CJY4_ACIRU|nr:MULTISPECIES: DUF3311 domain-containing protein [Acidiphilium]MBW4035907.1 DUF3311 domain-containing protein [Pseudomonadota bacterium]OYW02430.1 MAG: hypothetical protein B7Z58_07460 [Acidiphilium sp. 37-64-53]OZB30217.1 MAG: hypothetical protein B7X49_03590 [Acidiphilium sp. 34-64-41]SIQ63259.1 Protein of unknown function [Acidiphilium rubrum]HQT84379.1 DUF3311 domain-containing protein [Acidiphilium rubrum]